jgi:hypothetical protein
MQPVAAAVPLQALRLDAEVTTEPGDVVVQRLGRILGWIVGPQRLDQAFVPHRSATGERQHGQQRPAAGPGDGHLLAPDPQAQRTQDVHAQREC